MSIDIDPFRYYVWLDSLTFCDSEGGQCQLSMSIDPFKYGWIHLQPAIVKEDSVSCQSSINPFRYGWFHLRTAIVKEDSVSHKSSIDLSRYGWIHLHPAVNEDNVSRQSR